GEEALHQAADGVGAIVPEPGPALLPHERHHLGVRGPPARHGVGDGGEAHEAHRATRPRWRRGAADARRRAPRPTPRPASRPAAARPAAVDVASTSVTNHAVVPNAK